MASKNPQEAKITVYWLNKSRSQRILWLLEELELEYEVKVYQRGSDMLAPPELKEVHPLGKSPVIGIQTPRMEKPLIIAESAAIVEYLTDHFGKQLIPKRFPEGQEDVVGAETEEWIRYRFFMHYAEGSLMPLLLLALISQNIENAPVPFFLKFITRSIAGKIRSSFLDRNFKTHFGFLEEQLASSPGGGEFMCGKELTGADIMLSFPLQAAKIRSGYLTQEAYPKLFAYISRVQEREPYARATKKIEEVTGEKYSVV